ncbi:MAG TPA: hypothetical protein VFL19_04870, partial [Nitrospira sp.]|nr:hypothetical protein [Nitrospira sp.]
MGIKYIIPKYFLLKFAQRLYEKNEDPLHLFLEEADDYIPQKPMRDEAQLLRAWENIVRRGRARGLGMTIITPTRSTPSTAPSISLPYSTVCQKYTLLLSSAFPKGDLMRFLLLALFLLPAPAFAELIELNYQGNPFGNSRRGIIGSQDSIIAHAVIDFNGAGSYAATSWSISVTSSEGPITISSTTPSLG